MPVVSPKPISVAPAPANCSAMSITRTSGTSPSYGQPNEVAITAQKRSPASTIRGPIALTSVMVCPTVRLMFFLLCVSEALTNRATSSNRSRAASAWSRPLELGTSTSRATSGGRSMPLSTARPSDSCGITSGRTKLATSMRFRPVRPSASIRVIFSCVGMTSGSFWNPSRGPTSRMTAVRPAKRFRLTLMF